MSTDVQTTAAPAPPKRGYLLPGTIALVVLATIAAVVGVTVLQSHNPATLAGQEVATGISQAIQAQHPQPEPPDVTCPGSEPERTGLVFDCTLKTPGRAPQTIRVTETSPNGLFRYDVLPG